jgi:acetoacetate decarboxylase
MAKKNAGAKTPFANAYSNPVYAPLYPEPPMEYRDCLTIVATFRTTMDFLHSFVPAPLQPDPAGIMSAMIDDIFASGFGRYREFSLLVPVTFKGKSYGYIGYAIVDSDIAMAAGREIWGVPKKMGSIDIAMKDGMMRGTVERGGIELVKMAVTLDTHGDPAELGGSTGDYVQLKLIPSVERNTPPAVKQITHVQVTGLVYHKLLKGQATLQFAPSPADPFCNIPIVEMLGGMYVNCDRTLPCGNVLYDYLKD